MASIDALSTPSTPVDGIEGDFILYYAVVEALPKEAKVISAESWGISAWTKTARISAIFPDGKRDRYFLKCATGKTARSSMWGEHHSAESIAAVVPDFIPKPIGKGEYYDENGTYIAFYIQQYHDMDIKSPPDPAELASQMAKLHRNGTSPNGKFGYPVPTGGGVLYHENKWEDKWTKCFTTQFIELQNLDNEANEPWPEYDTVCQHVIDHVIPRLLDVLDIKPSLVHFDLWEGNVATDKETGKVLSFDPGCVYGHNELEFGTWRCGWSTHFQSSVYMMMYQREFEPSEPEEEWDDRNRLYAIRAAMCDSAGHPGSNSRKIAYNDMLFLCEKYAPLDTLEKYDPQKDISVTGITEAYDVMAGAKI